MQQRGCWMDAFTSWLVWCPNGLTSTGSFVWHDSYTWPQWAYLDRVVTWHIDMALCNMTHWHGPSGRTSIPEYAWHGLFIYLIWHVDMGPMDLMTGTYVSCNTLTMCCSVLPCAAVWCRVLQCGAVWCSVLHIDVMWHIADSICESIRLGYVSKESYMSQKRPMYVSKETYALFELCRAWLDMWINQTCVCVKRDLYMRQKRPMYVSNNTLKWHLWTYRVAKIHRMPYLYRSFSAKEP